MYRRIAAYHWMDPLEALQSLGGQPELMFLYSGLREHYTGQYSYLAWDLARRITGDSFSQIPETHALEAADIPLWFGYLGYEMRLDVERDERLKPCHIPLPDMCWNQYRHIMRFDHAKQKLEYYTLAGCEPMKMDEILPFTPAPAKHYVPETIFSNFSSAQYMQCVANTVAHIEQGNFYQANITRKFFGTMESVLEPISLFCELAQSHPAPYSALLRMDDVSILSASPECFLSIDGEGNACVRPIKGSARRGDSPQEDEAIIAALKASPKDHAENLMIVDLMRHDLARIAVSGSVQLEEYAGLYSYNSIHHLISTIKAKLWPETPLRDVLKALFPPGSMTGAPKVAAMNWCAQQERFERGIYSGAMGWLGAQQRCDLSVVIRTLIIKGNQFEFQAGGGIVADSDPQQELLEALIKTRAVCGALKLDETLLKAL